MYKISIFWQQKASNKDYYACRTETFVHISQQKKTETIDNTMLLPIHYPIMEAN